MTKEEAWRIYGGVLAQLKTQIMASVCDDAVGFLDEELALNEAVRSYAFYCVAEATKPTAMLEALAKRYGYACVESPIELKVDVFGLEGDRFDYHTPRQPISGGITMLSITRDEAEALLEGK